MQALITAISCWIAVGSVGAGQELQFESLTHDFGTVFSQETYEHTFRFRNTGALEIKITQVAAGCDCLLAKGTKTAVGPGEAGEFKVTLNTDKQEGRIAKTIAVRTDSAAQPQIALTLKAYVLRQGIRLSPSRAVLGDVKRAQGIQRTIQVTVRSQHEEIHVTKVVPSVGWLEASLSPWPAGRRAGVEPGHSAAYVLTLRPNLKAAPSGHFLEFVTLYTDSRRWPFEDVQVKGRIVD